MNFWKERARAKPFQSGYEDHNVEELEWGCLREAIQSKLSSFKAPTCIEIGCHVGYTTQKIVDLVKPNRYEASDIESEAVRAAEENKSKAHSAILNFTCSSATELKFESDSFDMGFSIRCLQNIRSLEEQKKAFSEMHRVLKKRAIFVLTENWQASLDQLNVLRSACHLSPITQPAHCSFLNESLKSDFLPSLFTIESEQHFASAYYFGTRFAKWLDADAQVNSFEDPFNLFFRGINQGSFKLKLGPSVIVLRK